MAVPESRRSNSRSNEFFAVEDDGEGGLDTFQPSPIGLTIATCFCQFEPSTASKNASNVAVGLLFYVDVNSALVNIVNVPAAVKKSDIQHG